MKKIFSFLLVASLLCAMFVMPSAAADNVNLEADVPFVEIAPKVDGVVNAGEYGSALPQHSYSENPEQFTHSDDHDDYNNWDVEFYSAWDAENIYMAWVVKSEIHHGLVKGTYDGNGNLISDEWPEDGSMLGHMWWNSCVQFILTPGAPGGDTKYASNYLEVGLCLLDDGDIGRVAWNYPTGVEEDEISINDWDAAIVRDDAAGTTVYEVAIPKEMSGLSTFGTDSQFGLTYAAAAQNNYLTDTKGMLEWQDGILGSKNADNAAIMTLADGDIEQEIINDVTEGEVPEEANAEGVVKIALDKINTKNSGEDAVVVTDLTMDWNGIYAYNMLFAPVEGEEDTYELVETLQGDGNPIAFTTEAEDAIVVSVHSDGVGAGLERFNTAYSLGVGSKVKLFGIDVAEGDMFYTNAMIYTTELVTVEPEVSEVVSEVESEAASEAESDVEVESKEESKAESKEESKEESKAATSTATSVADEEDGGNGPIIIVIVVIAVVAIAVVVVVLLKKKKA